MHRHFSKFISISSALTIIAGIAPPITANASSETPFTYRYKAGIIATAATPGTPDGEGTTPETPGGGTIPDNPEDNGSGTQPSQTGPVSCVDDPECTDRVDEKEYPNPMQAPLLRVVKGSYIEDDRWFYHVWSQETYLAPEYNSYTILRVKENSLPRGIEPSGWDIGGPWETLYGGVQGEALAVGTGKVVYDVILVDENGEETKASELTVKVEVYDIPTTIIAPTQNVLVGDEAFSPWFYDNYGMGSYVLKYESGTAPIGTTAEEQAGSFVGPVGEPGTFEATFAVHPEEYDPDTEDFVVGPKVSELKIKLEAKPNLHQAALIQLPDDEGSGIYPVTEQESVILNPKSDLDTFLNVMKYSYDQNYVSGATILGLQPGSCPGGVSWSLTGSPKIPPSMTAKKISDGLALLDYKLVNTPGGQGYNEKSLPKSYSGVRFLGVCRDGNGDPMVNYYSKSFTVRIASSGGDAS